LPFAAPPRFIAPATPTTMAYRRPGRWNPLHGLQPRLPHLDPAPQVAVENRSHKPGEAANKFAPTPGDRQRDRFRKSAISLLTPPAEAAIISNFAAR
jgi:hypothetical protein